MAYPLYSNLEWQHLPGYTTHFHSPPCSFSFLFGSLDGTVCLKLSPDPGSQHLRHKKPCHPLDGTAERAFPSSHYTRYCSVTHQITSPNCIFWHIQIFQPTQGKRTLFHVCPQWLDATFLLLCLISSLGFNFSSPRLRFAVGRFEQAGKASHTKRQVFFQNWWILFIHQYTGWCLTSPVYRFSWGL